MNTLVGNGGHTVILNGANRYVFSGNTVSLVDAVGGMCGINITGDTLDVQAIGNAVELNSSGADDYGACLNITGGHMLNNLIDGLSVVGFSQADYGFFFNNSVGEVNNMANIIRHVSCVHIKGCYKRIDPANNTTVYEDSMPGDAAFDAGTGSTEDIFIQPKLPFAALPNPAGNGSHMLCEDCISGSPAVNGGSGSMVFRVNGVWKGI
jgi:hypothetical protein